MIQLFNGDCLEAMKKMKDNEFDLAIVDPPYGINRSGQTKITCKKPKHNRKYFENKQWDSSTPNEDYFNELFRVSKNQVIWGANYFTQYIPRSMGWIVWDKGQYDLSMSDGELAFSSFERALRIFNKNRSALAKEGTIHPTQKPVALYTWLLDKYAKPGDLILDTHLGSGSIAIACHNLGFDLVGYELDQDYFQAAKHRLEEHQKQLRLF